MQLLPSTWDYVETVLIKHPVAHDADGNVHVGLAYLNHLLHAFNGNEQPRARRRGTRASER